MISHHPKKVVDRSTKHEFYFTTRRRSINYAESSYRRLDRHRHRTRILC